MKNTANITNGKDKFNSLLKGWAAYYKTDAQLFINFIRKQGFTDTYIATKILKGRKSRKSIAVTYPKEVSA